MNWLWVRRFFQVILRGALVNHAFVTQFKTRPACASDAVVALGLPVALDNLFWFHTGYKSYLISSIFSAVMWHVVILKPFCSAAASTPSYGFPVPVKVVLAFVQEYLDLFTGTHYDAGLQIDSCHQTFSFSHIYVCVFLGSFALWCLEKRSRTVFFNLESAGNQHLNLCENTYNESSGWTLLWFLTPLFWQGITMVQHLVILCTRKGDGSASFL